MEISVFANIHGENIRCQVIHAFNSSITQRGYIIVLSPFKTDHDVVIPVAFDPEMDDQEAEFIHNEIDKRIIEDIINNRRN